MKTWVKVLLGIGAFISVIVLIVAVVFYFTAGMVDSADGFFAAVKQKDMTKARTYLAEDFKASTDEKALTEFLTNSALLNVKESSWSNRQINNGRGELEGSISTETGGVVPITLSFVKENEAWKIYSIQKPAAGLKSEESSDSSQSVPGKPKQITLVKQSMHDFLISVSKKDMEHFRSTVSGLWQQQATTESLNQAFKSITDTNANWSVIENVEPALSSEANIDGDGVLHLKGFYPTKPSKVQFEQKFIYEGTDWKLIGFSIEAK